MGTDILGGNTPLLYTDRASIGVEDEPDEIDPTADCIENLRMLRGWLGAST